MIREITLSSEWNAFFNLNGSPSFLHSWEWGEFQAKLGYTPLRLGIYEGNSLVAIALVLKIKAKRANMLFIPHGPVVNLKFEIRNLKLLLSELLTYLKNITQKEGYSFIRIAPIFQDSKEHREMFSSLGFRTAPIYMHAERLWVLDITKDEGKILKGPLYLVIPTFIAEFYNNQGVLYATFGKTALLYNGSYFLFVYSDNNLTLPSLEKEEAEVLHYYITDPDFPAKGLVKF